MELNPSNRATQPLSNYCSLAAEQPSPTGREFYLKLGGPLPLPVAECTSGVRGRNCVAASASGRETLILTLTPNPNPDPESGHRQQPSIQTNYAAPLAGHRQGSHARGSTCAVLLTRGSWLGNRARAVKPAGSWPRWLELREACWEGRCSRSTVRFLARTVGHARRHPDDRCTRPGGSSYHAAACPGFRTSPQKRG